MEDLPPPEGPHSARTLPAATLRLSRLSTGRLGRCGYAKVTSLSSRRPSQRPGTSPEPSGGTVDLGARRTHSYTCLHEQRQAGEEKKSYSEGVG